MKQQTYEVSNIITAEKYSAQNNEYTALLGVPATFEVF
jgi:hypothetical protein